MTEINLNSAQRSAVLNLQDAQQLADRTTQRLATGKKVNSIADDAVSYFRSRSLSDRASSLLARKDDITQGLNTVQTTLEAVGTIDSFLKQLKGIAESQKSTTTNERKSADVTFKAVLQQISQVINDTNYGGSNLLKSSTNNLTVRFSDLTASAVKIGGFNLISNVNSTNANVGNNIFSKGASVFADNVGSANTIDKILSGLGGKDLASFVNVGTNNSNASQIDSITSSLDQAIYRVRGQASTFGAYAAILQTRSDFNSRYTSRLQSGADGLVNADLNEEGANLLAVQTRIQLGSNALSFATSTRNSVTRLIGA